MCWRLRCSHPKILVRSKLFLSGPLCWEKRSSSTANGTGELMCLENDCNTLSFPPAQKCSAQSDLLSSSSPALQTTVAARVHNTVWTETSGWGERGETRKGKKYVSFKWWPKIPDFYPTFLVCGVQLISRKWTHLFGENLCIDQICLFSLKSNALLIPRLFLRRGSVEGECLEPSSLLPWKCH